MQEGDALIAGIGPEERGPNPLGQRQADGTAGERADHVSDGGIAQLPFEDDREKREAEAEKQIRRRQRAERVQQKRRVHDCPGEEQAGK